MDDALRSVAFGSATLVGATPASPVPEAGKSDTLSYCIPVHRGDSTSTSSGGTAAWSPVTSSTRYSDLRRNLASNP